MVAYSFKKRFAPEIIEGTKAQTIRGPRVRHARPGEKIQLYVGMRTKSCRKIISDPVCLRVDPIGIWVPTKLEPAALIQDGRRTYITDAFARADGFADIEDFTRFWFDTHGPGEFSGVLIAWQPPRHLSSTDTAYSNLPALRGQDQR